MLSKRNFFINFLVILFWSIFPKITSAQVKCFNNYLFAPPKYQQNYKKKADSRQPPSGTKFRPQEPPPLDYMPFISKKNKCFLIKLHVLSSPQPDNWNEQIKEAFQRVNFVYQKAGIYLELDVVSIYDKSIAEIKINQNQKEKVLLDYPLNYFYKYINLYVVDNLILDGQLADGAAMFPEDNLDVIFIKTSKFNDGLTLLHELGHFFGLFHTCETFDDKAAIGDDGLQSTPKDAYFLFNNQDLSDVCFTRFVEKDGIRYYSPVENIMSLYAHCDAIPKLFLPEQLAYMRQIALHERKYLRTTSCEMGTTSHRIEWNHLQHNSIDYLLEIFKPKKQILIVILDDRITWCQRLLTDMDEDDTFVNYVEKEVICIVVNPKKWSKKQQEDLLGNLSFRNGQEGIKISLSQKYLDPDFAFYPIILLVEQFENKIVHRVLEGYLSTDKLLKILKAPFLEGAFTKN